MIEGKNIKLRAMEPADIEFMYLWENDPDVWAFSNTSSPFSRFYLEQYIINSHNDIYTDKQLRMIITSNSNSLMGCVDIFDFDPKNLRAGVGILVDKNHRNKKIATEALELVSLYAHQTLNLHQLFCNIAEDNKLSLELFQKRGFVIAGLKKEWILRGKNYVNEYILQKIF